MAPGPVPILASGLPTAHLAAGLLWLGALGGGIGLLLAWDDRTRRWGAIVTGVVLLALLGSPDVESEPRDRLAAAMLTGRGEDPQAQELARRFPFSHVLVNRRAGEQVAADPGEGGFHGPVDEEALARAAAWRLVYEHADFAFYEPRPPGPGMP